MLSDHVLSLILRWSVFGTFFGHGCLAVRFVPGWMPYLRVVGIGNEWARRFMPMIGLLDVLVAFIYLFTDSYPLIHCWAFVWGLSTAMIRPLSGESIFGCIERTGNFLPALALLWLSSGQQFSYYLFVCVCMIGSLAISGLIFKTTGIFNK
ncbi:unnamed protein product [Rotaria sp. Silwood1]|nr:unnamed protein product [Rotaria sp. Silwood1]CAF3526680.1 unnamed protein product [Rotaria sp. Silwood1]CAF3538146.1 unnamed protein product [Rotaria sp. Silwood1]CAF4701539.1 unnamed protein product [Rotaria sp. Silwood1]CAF4898865.1 unnamed protein product [Rotaria sp. Silwood1]